MAVLTGLCAAVFPRPTFASSQNPEFLTISRDDDYDKTLAGILGQVSGFLSGYEFMTTDPLPHEWFRLTYGPYSGDSPYWGSVSNGTILDAKHSILPLRSIEIILSARF